MSHAVRRVLALLGSTGVITAVMAGAPPSVGAQDVIPNTYDLTVTVGAQEVPAVAVDQNVKLVFTVSNVGIIAGSSDLAVTLPTGSTFDPAESSPTCAAAGTDAICRNGSLEPGQSISHTVFFAAPDAVGDVVTTGTLTNIQVIPGAVEYSPNNSASATTTISAGGAGWVKCGDSIETEVSGVDGRQGHLLNPASPCNGPLPVLRFALVGANEVLACQSPTGPTCKDGFETIFGASEQATSDAPVVATDDVSITGVCKGVGAGAECPDFVVDFYESRTAPAFRVPRCTNGQLSPAQERCILSAVKLTSSTARIVQLKAANGIDLQPILKAAGKG